tara:strand:- start:247 stop:1278 length:1032 start_codon:yes stop_codon:yes gene_type:complete
MPSYYSYRYVSLQNEKAAYGTADGTEYFGEVDDESFNNTFDLLTRSDMSRMGSHDSVAGTIRGEGGLNLVLQNDHFCAMLLGAAYNSYTYTSGSDKHTFTESVTAGKRLPSYRITVGREDEQHNYPGMCLNRLSLSANVGEYVMLSADFVGKGETAETTLNHAPSFEGASTTGFHFAEADVFFSDSGAAPSNAGANVKSFSVEFNLNLDTDNSMALGSQEYVTQPMPQMREITGTIEFALPKTGAVGANNEPTYSSVNTDTDAAVIYEGTDYAIKLALASGSDTLDLFLYRVVWDAPVMNVSGRDSSTMSVGFTALTHSSTNLMSKVEMVMADVTDADLDLFV